MTALAFIVLMAFVIAVVIDRINRPHVYRGCGYQPGTGDGMPTSPPNQNTAGFNHSVWIDDVEQRAKDPSVFKRKLGETDAAFRNRILRTSK